MKYDLREWQLFEVGILDKVVEICNKNNIQYFLSSGTLLGAVRHKGFIPWDDDIDINMPINEYKKFCRLPQEEFVERGLFLQTYKTDPKCSWSWAMVRANNTTSMPVSSYKWNIHWGIHIDVFPLIGLYESPILRKLQLKLFKFNRTLLEKDYYETVQKGEFQASKRIELLYKLPDCIRRAIISLNDSFIDRDFWSAKEGRSKWYNLNSRYNPDFFKESIDILFEGKEYKAPLNYDAHLTMMYGDYMTPPPENERGGHEMLQGDTIRDLNKDYSEYQKQLIENNGML